MARSKKKSASRRQPGIIDTRHPLYTSSERNWRKWRLTYEGGDRFIHQYLKRFSKRESNEEFYERKAVSYSPSFGKAAVNDIKNAIFQRTCDVARRGGSDSYTQAVKGLGGGVDLLGSSMNSFIGRQILPELLTMERVGIFVDMPTLENNTKQAVKNKRPYLYWYPVEDVLSWRLDGTDDPNEYSEILVVDTITVSQRSGDTWDLPFEECRRYRHMWKDEDGQIWLQLYNEDGLCCDRNGDADSEEAAPMALNIKRIPFHMLAISESLLNDAANYQIALLNLASSDMGYALRANFPFYVEQAGPNVANHLKQELPKAGTQQQNAWTGTTLVATQQNVNEVQVGVSSGRKYPMNANQPAFIHPSSEPLQASMAKQEQLKIEIRQLVNLAVSNLAPKATSAESKRFDNQGLEAGLSYIGLELEHAERRIAEFWAMYEGTTPATVNYPENYSLITDEERLEQGVSKSKLIPILPSKTYQKEVAKDVASTLLDNKVSAETMDQIHREIDTAVIVSVDPEVIASDFENGFVGLETASMARGYPKGEVEKAKKDHAERAARIAIAQSTGGGEGANANLDSRGVSDLSADPKGASQEKTASRDTTTDTTPTDKTRGEGK